MSAPPATGRGIVASKVRVHRFDEADEHKVRFCGPVESIHVHWPSTKKARASACIGPHCPSEIHKQRLAWQGFLAAEIWRKVTQTWEPIVAQITPNWFDLLKDRNPRGTIWLAQRAVNTYGKEEIVAHLVGHVDPSTLRTDIQVRIAVCCVYHEPGIAWNRPPVLTQRQVLLPSVGDAPPTENPPLPADQIEGTPEYNAKLKQKQEEIRAAGGMLKWLALQQKEGRL
jgi:hypothetical protein